MGVNEPFAAATQETVAPGWDLVYETTLPPRPAVRVPCDDLPVAETVRRFIRSAVPAGIYGHQHRAIASMASGQNVCLATSTASGKSLAFQAAGLDALCREAESVVLALYPQRSLGNEQEERWRAVLAAEGVGAVGRIDGSVSSARRAGILRNSRVVVMTPDVMHAWLLSNLANADVRSFLARLRLVVADEVHTYTGVFGSNAAYLFRRLQHAVSALGGRAQFFCASATISDPQRHLDLLFGKSFTLIGADEDSSPRQPVRVQMVNGPRDVDFLTAVTRYIQFLVDETSLRFIAFVESRKQAEHIAAILGRVSDGGDGDDPEIDGGNQDPLLTSDVLPYRSGYEEGDRRLIERRLRDGSLRGVVSTSALELGIDVPGLDMAMLVGVPRSSTSFQQRIGRAGRARAGYVVVINSGEIFDEAVFRHPETLLTRPPAEGALYLENPRIQYIHALCLARPGGEHDAATQTDRDARFSSAVVWPTGFVGLCELERTGQISAELQAMKAECGDDPNHVFPMRDVEAQFKIEHRAGRARERLGFVSHGQLMREAYPGAIYYYATRPYRVYSISHRERLVLVRKEKRYTTQPRTIPPQVYPNFAAGNVFRGVAYGDLHALECNINVREAVLGFKERRGGAEDTVDYPLVNTPTGVNFTESRFARMYFTTGVLLTHPRFAIDSGAAGELSQLLFEALLMTAPYERQDLGYGTDRVRAAGPLAEGAPFVAIYDQTYGSLRLSGRLLEPDVLPAVARSALELAVADESGRISNGVIELARDVAAATKARPVKLNIDAGTAAPTAREGALVIMPGSRGIDRTSGNVEFVVERVHFHPRLGLAYRGRHDGAVRVADQFENIRVDALVPIPGETQLGTYDFESGEITPLTT